MFIALFLTFVICNRYKTDFGCGWLAYWFTASKKIICGLEILNLFSQWFIFGEYYAFVTYVPTLVF